MKKIDWSWRGFGIDFDPRYRYTIDLRWISAGVNSYRRVTRQGFLRGRCRERELRVPLVKDWQFEFSTRGQDYLTLVGGPKYLKNLNWILDEFDASFNDLAIASLKYHLDFSVCDNEDRRELYEDLIARLGEDPPTFTDDEMAVLRPPGWTFEDGYEKVDGGYLVRKTTPERKVVYAAFRQREAEYHERIQRARHDLVDVMRQLWS